MNSDTGWETSSIGRVARFIGSVRFAVPVLALAAVAMIVGTFVDSTVGTTAALSFVYASPWFITLMALICASLILSVAVRYPWQRKHVGFIIVHASLVALIAIGFFTMFTKEEGQVALDKNESSDRMMTKDRWIELVEHRDTGFAQLGYAVLDEGAAARSIAGGKPVEFSLTTPRAAEGEPEVTDTVVLREIWANCGEVTRVTNDGESPLHAVEVLVGTEGTVGDWVGEVRPTDRAPDMGGFVLRVMPTGQVWAPPASELSTVLLDADKAEHPIPEAGAPLGETGWTVTSVEHFERATIGADGMRERESGQPNPAVQLVLTHTDGSVERQIAFESLRDSPFLKQMAGQTASGWAITYRGESFAEPTLAVMRDADGTLTALYAGTDGTRESFAHDGLWPWRLTAAGGVVTVLQDFDNARAWTTLEQRPEADLNRPAVVVEAPGTGERVTARCNTPRR